MKRACILYTGDKVCRKDDKMRRKVKKDTAMRRSSPVVSERSQGSIGEENTFKKYTNPET